MEGIIIKFIIVSSCESIGLCVTTLIYELFNISSVKLLLTFYHIPRLLNSPYSVVTIKINRNNAK